MPGIQDLIALGFSVRAQKFVTLSEAKSLMIGTIMTDS